MLPIIFVMPIVQLLVLSYAATFDVHDIQVGVIDYDKSESSRLLAAKLEASGYFKIVDQTQAPSQTEADMLSSDVQMILSIPFKFEGDIQRFGSADIQIIIDAEDGATAGVIQAYAIQIISSFNKEIRLTSATSQTAIQPLTITTVPRFWFNPDQNYTTYMVPGILVVLVTMIGMFLSSMNVVREKEIGTIEQLNVTPIRKHEFIVGKLAPFWILALLELAIGLVIARLVFDLPMLGSVTLVFAIAAIYLLVMLGLGLWISTHTETQQQAMFISWFFAVIFILMSGLFTPSDSMPMWAQRLNLLNPIAYFIDIMRRILLTGATFLDVMRSVLALIIYAGVVLGLAVTQYRKVTA